MGERATSRPTAQDHRASAEHTSVKAGGKRARWGCDSLLQLSDWRRLLSFSVITGRTVTNVAPGPWRKLSKRVCLFSDGSRTGGRSRSFEWWPIVRRRNSYQRLSAAEVELRPFKDERLQIGSDAALLLHHDQHSQLCQVRKLGGRAPWGA